MIPQVLATVGGGGTRLYPLTLNLPKPLVEICDTAVIAVLFRLLAVQGCRRFILGSKGAVNTLELCNYFKAGEGFFKRLGINDPSGISYQPQYDDKGSADSLQYCLNYFNINSDILVVSGDHLIDIDLKKLICFHQRHKPVLTVVVKEMQPSENLSQYGVANIDKNFRMTHFVEKPKNGTELSRTINTAFYLFSHEIREVLHGMGDAARDIGGDLIPFLVENGYKVCAYPVTGYWIGMGTPERLHQATMDVLSGRINNFAFRHEYRANQWVHPSTLSKIQKHLDSGDIELKGNVSIGRNCRIEKGTVIENSHIGHTNMIERDTEIRKSTVMSFCNIKREVIINGSIVGRHSTIGTNSILDGDQPPSDGRIPVIGEDVTMPAESVISPGTRVAPIRYSTRILSSGRFIELEFDDKNIYFAERVR